MPTKYYWGWCPLTADCSVKSWERCNKCVSYESADRPTARVLHTKSLPNSAPAHRPSEPHLPMTPLAPLVSPSMCHSHRVRHIATSSAQPIARSVRLHFPDQTRTSLSQSCQSSDTLSLTRMRNGPPCDGLFIATFVGWHECSTRAAGSPLSKCNTCSGIAALQMPA